MGGDSLGDLVDFHPVGGIVGTVDAELALDPVAARSGRYSLVFLLLHPDRLLRGRAFCFLEFEYHRCIGCWAWGFAAIEIYEGVESQRPSRDLYRFWSPVLGIRSASVSGR